MTMIAFSTNFAWNLTILECQKLACSYLSKLIWLCLHNCWSIEELFADSSGSWRQYFVHYLVAAASDFQFLVSIFVRPFRWVKSLVISTNCSTWFELFWPTFGLGTRRWITGHALVNWSAHWFSLKRFACQWMHLSNVSLILQYSSHGCGKCVGLLTLVMIKLVKLWNLCIQLGKAGFCELKGLFFFSRQVHML